MPNSRKIGQAAELIQKAKHAVALTGAGISTRSGIPDFRSRGSGLWYQSDPMNVASLWGFMENPQAFYDWIRPLTKTFYTAKPNPAHYAIAELEKLGRIHAVITQNIDDLHQFAGSRRVLQVHGHMRQATCIRCYTMVGAQPLMDQFLSDGIAPRCKACGGSIKPNVVLFGEMLPVSVMYEAQQEAQTCDVMLVAGSSLEVEPVAGLPLLARRNGAKLILVNKSPTGLDVQAEVIIHDDVTVALSKIVEIVKQG